MFLGKTLYSQCLSPPRCIKELRPDEPLGSYVECTFFYLCYYIVIIEEKL